MNLKQGIDHNTSKKGATMSLCITKPKKENKQEIENKENNKKNNETNLNPISSTPCENELNNLSYVSLLWL